MTQARATKRRTSLEKHKDEVVALLLTGWTQEQVATKYKVNPSSVHRFIDRHADRLEDLRAEVAKQTTDYAIADKVNRIAELQHWYDLTRQEADEFGITVVERVFTMEGKGDDAKEVVTETRDYRASLVKEARGILHQVAEELAQLPKPSVNIDNRSVNVFSIQIDDGSDSNPDA